MGWLYQLFFPAHTPTENELEMGRYRIIAEGAVAGVIYAVATGNFLAGYLSSLGASVSLCAAAAMIPSFGCVLQFFSPFVFERMHHRKLAIWLMCVVFRLSISSILLVPLALPDPGHARAVVLVLYTIGFFSAGLVTPGLEHMVLGIAPQGGRGQFYAVKSIIGTCVSSAATLALGRVLDYYLEQGQGYTGFLIIGIVSLSLTVVDAVLLASVRENPVKFTSKMRPADTLARGTKMKIMASIRKAMIICMAYWIKAIMSPICKVLWAMAWPPTHTISTESRFMPNIMAGISRLITRWTKRLVSIKSRLAASKRRSS